MWDCRFVGLAVLLALRSFASGFSDRETLDSASAHRFEEDLNGQWEGIFADLSRPSASHEHHCWPHAHSGKQPGAAISTDHKIEASEHSGFELNLTEANFVADLQTTVYCNRTLVRAWDCTRCRSAAAGFEPHKLVFVSDWDLTALVGRWPLLDAVFVTFRGTDSHDLGNWVADMDMRMTNYVLLPTPPQPDQRAPDDHLQATAGSLRSQLTAEDAYSGFALEDDGAVADEDRPRVHSGFLRSLMQSGLYQGVHDALRTLPARPGSAPQRLFVTGHSLGAAMAALAAPMLLRDFAPPEIRLYTFGAPRTGNQAFVDLLMASVDYSVRFTHSHDIVPSLPPPFFGFRHFPHEVWQIDPQASRQAGADQNHSEAVGHLDSFVLHPGQQSAFEMDSDADNIRYVCRQEGSAAEQNFTFRICDGSGEDLECHDSLCYWAPCHSLRDHIFYLGKHMYHREEEC